MDKGVLALVEVSRKCKNPVTRATIMSFGVAAKNKLLAAEATPAGDKKKLETFGASEKWAKNFIARNGMVSTALHGEAGSVDAEAIEKGLEEIREECKKYALANIFNIDETSIRAMLTFLAAHAAHAAKPALQADIRAMLTES